MARPSMNAPPALIRGRHRRFEPESCEPAEAALGGKANPAMEWYEACPRGTARDGSAPENAEAAGSCQNEIRWSP
jgi:hypothetical protein